MIACYGAPLLAAYPPGTAFVTAAPTPQQPGDAFEQAAAQNLSNSLLLTGAGLGVGAIPSAATALGFDAAATATGTALAVKAGVGAVAGAGFDVAGQMMGGQPYRPGQTAVSAVVGAIGAPLAGESTMWNALLAGFANTDVTGASNMMYGEDKSLLGAFGVGIAGGATGSYFGKLTASKLSNVLPQYIGGMPIVQSLPRLVQNYGVPNPYPGVIGEAVNQTVTGLTPSVVDKLTSDKGAKP